MKGGGDMTPKNGKNAKYTDEMKEKAILLYATNGNITETARTLGIAKSTVHKWINAPEMCEQVEQMRTEKRIEFADKASELIDKGLLLLERRLDTAIKREEELEILINEISLASNDEMPQQTKTALISKIKSLELQKLGEITTAVGTLFDKRALARGESTTSTEIKITLGGELQEWAK